MANQAPKIGITKEVIGLIAAVIALIGAVIGLVTLVLSRPQPAVVPAPANQPTEPHEVTKAAAMELSTPIAEPPTGTPTTQEPTGVPPTPTETETPQVVIVAPPSCPRPTVTPEDEIIVRLRWSATTVELAENGADKVDFVFLVDGQNIGDIKPYRRAATIYSPLEVDGCGRSEPAGVVLWDVPVGRLTEGHHTISVQYVLEETVSDGFDTYSPGPMEALITDLDVLP